MSTSFALAALLVLVSPISVGIGIETATRGDSVVIVQVFSESGASEAGVAPGSILRSVGGTQATPANLQEIIKLSFGEVGSKVEIQVTPPGTQSLRTFKITRRRYSLGSKPLAAELLQAVKRKNELEAKRFVEAGAEVNVTDATTGKTPLMYAAFYSMPQLVEGLIRRGASVGTRDKKQRTALLWAAGYGKPDNIEVHRTTLRLLIRAGSDVNAQGIDGWTPLMQEARGGDIEMIKELLAAGAAKNVINNGGDNAEEIARQAGHSAIAELLSK